MFSKNVNLVVYGEDAGSKFEKAKSLGIELIDETSFLDLVSDKKDELISANTDAIKIEENISNKEVSEFSQLSFFDEF